MKTVYNKNQSASDPHVPASLSSQAADIPEKTPTTTAGGKVVGELFTSRQSAFKPPRKKMNREEALWDQEVPRTPAGY